MTVTPFKQPVTEIIEQISKSVTNLHNVPFEEISKATVCDNYTGADVRVVDALALISLRISEIALATCHYEKERKC